MARFETRPGLLPHRSRADLLELQAPLLFVDDDGTVYTVPAGWAFDGASIPRLLWPFVGHPMSPRYLYAAALHDWLCVTRTHASHHVHAMLGRALRAAGASSRIAALFAFGARWFGPSWSLSR